MVNLSSVEKYEEAQLLKDKIISLEKYQSKSTIVNPKIDNVDVFSIVNDESHAYVNFLQIAFNRGTNDLLDFISSDFYIVIV